MICPKCGSAVVPVKNCIECMTICPSCGTAFDAYEIQKPEPGPPKNWPKTVNQILTEKFSFPDLTKGSYEEMDEYIQDKPK